MSKSINKRKINNRRKPAGDVVNRTLTQVLGPQIAGNYTAGFAWIKAGMKYSDTFDTTMTTGTVSTQVFRANSIFDPDRTNTGHQPLTFDAYFLLYNRYHVYAISWHIRASGAADAYHMACGVVNGTETFTSVTDFRTFREGPKVRDYTSSYGSPAIESTGHENLNKFNGCSLVAYMTDDRFGSTMVTNPVEIIDFIVMFYNPTANTVLVHWIVDIKFHLVLHDPLIGDPSRIKRRYFEQLVEKEKFTVI